MARGVNKVILVGNIGQDPETRYLPSGGAVTNISVATSESWKDKQSGETKDVLNAVKVMHQRKGQVLGVLNVLGSTLMHQSDVYLPLACGYEISVPATKTFLNQAVLLL